MGGGVDGEPRKLLLQTPKKGLSYTVTITDSSRSHGQLGRIALGPPMLRCSTVTMALNAASSEVPQNKTNALDISVILMRQQLECGICEMVS